MPDPSTTASEPGDGLHVDGYVGAPKKRRGLSVPYLAHLIASMRARFSDDEMRDMSRASRAHAGGAAKAAKATRVASDVTGDGSDISGSFVELADLCAFSDDEGTGSWTSGEFVLAMPFTFSEPPDRMPLLPKPGTHTHPTYGKIAITRERNQHFIDQFNARVYQHPLPIDAEHQTLQSGAFGWINDLAMNEDGSVDGLVSWSDRGVAAIRGDRFKFISPSWFNVWPDSLDDSVKHTDVLNGAALTTRPFFKNNRHGALRALVATEDGLSSVEGDDFGDVLDALSVPDDVVVGAPLNADPAKPAADKENPMSVDVAKFTELEQKFAEMEAKHKADADAAAAAVVAAQAEARQASEAAATATAANTAMSERLAQSEAREQRQRFAEIVDGRNEAGARWLGATEENVETLVSLARVAGEDSDVFKSTVKALSTAAKQAREAGLFGQVGFNAPVVTSGPEGLMARKVAALRAADPKLTEAAAFAEAMNDPEAQRAYQESIPEYRAGVR